MIHSPIGRTVERRECMREVRVEDGECRADVCGRGDGERAQTCCLTTISVYNPVTVAPFEPTTPSTRVCGALHLDPPLSAC
jgi:hypothetical protein